MQGSSPWHCKLPGTGTRYPYQVRPIHHSMDVFLSSRVQRELSTRTGVSHWYSLDWSSHSTKMCVRRVFFMGQESYERCYCRESCCGNTSGTFCVTQPLHFYNFLSNIAKVCFQALCAATSLYWNASEFSL